MEHVGCDTTGVGAATGGAAGMDRFMRGFI
jgi:hypothetical protein